MVTGIGRVSGREVMIIANDATVKGGSLSAADGQEAPAGPGDRPPEPPAVRLPGRFGRRVPAAPVRGLPRPRPLRPDLLQPGAHVSALGIPQVAVVMGSCTAGGAYVPAMSDETIIVKNQGTIFLAGPPLVKAATGEEVSAEELGGGDVHTRISGRGRPPGRQRARRARTGRATSWRTLTARKRDAAGSSTLPEPPAFDPGGARRRHPARTRASRTTCAKSSRAWSTAAGSTSSRPATAPRSSPASPASMGFPVGILANNGVLFSESALKATHFIELACARKIPLLFLQNITGFMVGKEYEQRRHRQGRGQDGARGRERGGAEVHGDHRRQLRRRQLRHVRPRLLSRDYCGCGRTRASA